MARRGPNKRFLSRGENPAATWGGTGKFATKQVEVGVKALNLEVLQWAEGKGVLEQTLAAYRAYYEACSASAKVEPSVGFSQNSRGFSRSSFSDNKKFVAPDKAKRMASSWWRPGEGPVEVGDSVSVASSVSSIATGVSVSRYYVHSASEIDELGEGYCYMSVIARDAFEGVKEKLGSWPTLKQLLSLDAGVFIPADLFKYRRVLCSGGIVHIGGNNGEVNFAEFAEKSGCLGNGLKQLGLSEGPVWDPAVATMRVGGREPAEGSTAKEVASRAASRANLTESLKSLIFPVSADEFEVVNSLKGFEGQEGMCYLQLFQEDHRNLIALQFGSYISVEALITAVRRYELNSGCCDDLRFRLGDGRVWHLERCAAAVGTVSARVFVRECLRSRDECGVASRFGFSSGDVVGGTFSDMVSACCGNDLVAAGESDPLLGVKPARFESEGIILVVSDLKHLSCGWQSSVSTLVDVRFPMMDAPVAVRLTGLGGTGIVNVKKGHRLTLGVGTFVDLVDGARCGSHIASVEIYFGSAAKVKFVFDPGRYSQVFRYRCQDDPFIWDVRASGGFGAPLTLDVVVLSKDEVNISNKMIANMRHTSTVRGGSRFDVGCVPSDTHFPVPGKRTSIGVLHAMGKDNRASLELGGCFVIGPKARALFDRGIGLGVGTFNVVRVVESSVGKCLQFSADTY